MNILKKSIWLHNIRSVYNVGSIFRTADAVGIDHIYLSGYTPLPIDRFGRERSDFAKVAIGAEKTIHWSYVETPELFFNNQDQFLIAIEQDKDSENIFDFKGKDFFSNKEIVLVVGEEVSGLENWQKELCQRILEIPMYGKKESLNVSVAFGIAVYQIFIVLDK